MNPISFIPSRCRFLIAGFFLSLLIIPAGAAVQGTLDAAAQRAGNQAFTTLTSSTTQTVYLRFKVDGVTADRCVITKATLRLYKTAGSGTVTITAANNSRSDSDSLLWWNSSDSVGANPPRLAPNPLPSTLTTNLNWMEFEITDQYITGDGVYSFAITSDQPITFAPKNNANEPQLVFETGTTLDKANYAAIELLEQGPAIADRYDLATSGTSNHQSYYFKYGVIDATKQPYGAKPGDNNDDRLAIQRAINDARLARAVVYLPTGTYLVSDTIEMVQGSIKQKDVTARSVNPTQSAYMIGHGPFGPDYAGTDLYIEKWTNGRDFGNALMGKPGARPKLKLMDTPTGNFDFDPDPSNATTPVAPKPLLRIWSRVNATPDLNGDGQTGVDVGEREQDVDARVNKSGSNYNQTVSNIDFDLNAETHVGNRGATAITSGSAQGSVISDCTITATGAFSGCFGSTGPGGGMHNITFTKGKYGLYVDIPKSGQQLLLSACTFTDQTEKSIYWGGLGGLTAVGTNITGKGIQVVAASNQPWNGMLCLVDSQINLTSADLAIDSTRSVYMNRVFVKNGVPIINPDVNLPAPGSALLSSTSWIRVDEYAGGVKIDQNPYDTPTTATGVPYYITGNAQSMSAVSNATYVDSQVASAGSDFHNAHDWPATPWFLDSEVSGSGVISVMAYGAVGDGVSDDTTAIQNAIEFAATNGKNVFLPKGDYRVSKSLHLHDGVKLFGIHKNFTTIQSMYSDLTRTNTPGDFYSTPAAAKPLMVVDTGATGMLSDLALVQRITDAGSNLLDWKGSASAVVKNVTFLRRPMETTSDGQNELIETPMILVEGSTTGGKFYHIWGVASSQKEPFSPARHLKVTGTQQPLAFYMANFEYAHNLPQMEITSASQVDIYQSKFEGNYRNLYINGCNKIRVFGVGGNSSPFPSNVDTFTGTPYSQYTNANQNIWVQNSTDFLIAGQSYQLRAKSLQQRVGGPVMDYDAQAPDVGGVFPDLDGNGINDNMDVYATSVGASTDPALYDRLKETPPTGGGPVKKAPGYEQFVLYKRGTPPPLY